MKELPPLPGLRQLEMLADADKARRYPNLPDHARVRAKYSDASANDLTTAIVAWLDLHGYASRLSSTGTYRDDLNKYVPSKQKRGLPDVFGIVEGIAYFVEVKMPGDKLSAEQRDTIGKLQQAGARCFVAATFQSFFEWWIEQTAPPFP